MKQYRLLRNNKETGPHTAEELIQSGFKKYDLIWAEGKSAAWRYPGELQEFTPYAPVIEEQPYDRFYKKTVPVNTQKKETRVSAVSETKVTTAQIQKPRIKIKADCKKIELPQVNEPILKKEVTKNLQAQHTDTPEWKDMWLDWEEEKKAASTITVKKNEVQNTPVLETKYSQSFEEIKERYAETILKPKNKSSFSKNNNYITAVILITAILGTGIWMGVKWSGSNDVKTEPVKLIGNQAVVSTEDAMPALSKEEPLQSEVIKNIPVSGTAEEKIENDIKKTSPTVDNTISQNTTNKKNTATVKTASGIKNNPNQVVSVKPPVTKPAENEKKYTVTNTKESNTVTDKKTIAQNTSAAVPSDRNDVSTIFRRSAKEPHIKDYISVETYTPSLSETVGVKYSVQNISDINVDLVMIDLQYYDAGGHYQKGETVYARNIAAGQTVTIMAPDNTKAAKINFKVSMISSEAKSLYLIAD